MPARAVAKTEESPSSIEPRQQELSSDILFIAVPVVTYKKISDEASRRNMSFVSAIEQALQLWMDRKC